MLPATINGKSWAIADFQNAKHSDNLGPFLYDCLIDFRSQFLATSGSGVTVGTGTKNFVVELGKKFVTGQRLRAVANLAGIGGFATAWVNGMVVSYNPLSGLLVLDVATTFGAGTYFSWLVCPGPLMVATSATVPLTRGGTGTTTAEGAAVAMGVRPPSASMQEVIEDFLGYFPDIDASNPTVFPRKFESIPRGFSAEAFAAGTIVSGGNYTVSERNSRPDQNGDHPGIAVMKVTAAPDMTCLALGVNAFGVLRGHSSVERAGVVFYLSTLPTVAQSYLLKVGLRYNTPGGGRPVFVMDGPANSFKLGPSGTEPLTKAEEEEILAGHWYTLEVTADTTDTLVTLTRHDPDLGNVQVFQSGGANPPANNNAFASQPFIELTKQTGGESVEVLVDALYMSRRATR